MYVLIFLIGTRKSVYIYVPGPTLMERTVRKCFIFFLKADTELTNEKDWLDSVSLLPTKLGFNYFLATRNLIVLAIWFSLCIEDSGPVLGFESGLVVNINLYFYNTALSLTRVNWNSSWLEKSSYNLSNWWSAPVTLSNGTSFQVKFGSKDWVLDASINYLSEWERLVDRWALVSKSENTSLFIYSNANSKSSGNTRSGFSRGWELVLGDTWYIGELWLDLSSIKSSSLAGEL